MKLTLCMFLAAAGTFTMILDENSALRKHATHARLNAEHTAKVKNRHALDEMDACAETPLMLLLNR